MGNVPSISGPDEDRTRAIGDIAVGDPLTGQRPDRQEKGGSDDELVADGTAHETNRKFPMDKVASISPISITEVVFCDFGRVYYVGPYKTGSCLHAESTIYVRFRRKSTPS